MNFINISFISVFFVFLTSACGVKGDPQPPLTPPLLGRGEPSFSKATEALKIKKKNKPSLEPDWDEPADFPEELKLEPKAEPKL